MEQLKPYCDQHGDTCATLHRIELGVSRIEEKFEGLGGRILLLERIVFGGVALVLVSVVGAVLAIVLRTQ